MERERGKLIGREVKSIKDDLQNKQRKRMEMLLARMEPLIIKDGPSQKTTYKMHARNLHTEIFPLNQRIRKEHLFYNLSFTCLMWKCSKLCKKKKYKLSKVKLSKG